MGSQLVTRIATEMEGIVTRKTRIREARSDGQVVLGVAIGADIDVLQKMYGNDFTMMKKWYDGYSFRNLDSVV